MISLRTHDASAHSRLNHASVAIVAAVAALGTLLRLIDLGSKSPWLDEISTVMFVRLNWPAFWQLVREREANMLVYYLALRAWIHLGNSEFMLRLPSVIFGVATLPAIYILGKELFDRPTGVLAALLLAVNAAHVRASQWMRSYSLVLLLIVLSTLLFVRAVERPRRSTWALYTVVATAAIYNHFMAGLLVAAQWLTLLFLPSRFWPRRHLAAVAGALALLAGPAGAYILTRNVGQLNWVANPRPIELYHLAVFWAAGGGKVLGALLLAAFVGVIAVTAREFRTLAADDRWRWHYACLFTCVAFPPAVSFLLSFWKPIFFYRYLIICLPACLLLVARGLTLLSPRWLIASGTVIVALSVTAVALSYRPEEDWKGACTYLLTHARDGDVVLFSGRGADPLEYYRWRIYGEAAGPRLRTTGYPGSGQQGKIYAYFFHRVWYVHFPSFVTDAKIREVESHLAEAYPVHHESKFKAIGVTLYETGKE
jgi:mannosyltransferase